MHEMLTPSGDNRTKGNGKIIRHGLPATFDKMQEAELERLRAKCFANFPALYKNQFLYRKAQHDYHVEAQKLGVSSVAATNHHKKMIYEQVQKLSPNKAGGQDPSSIIISGTSEDHSFEIFSHNAYSNGENIWANGAFGVAINIRRKEHCAHIGAFESAAYMVQHLADEGRHVPYIMCVADFGKKDTKVSAEEKIGLMNHMREIMIRQLADAKFTVVREEGKVPYLYIDAKDKLVKTYLPLVFHDLSECRYYVCEDGQKELFGANKTPFEDWARKMELNADPRVRNHLEALKLHRQEAGYFDEYVLLTYKRKKIMCVDSREEEQMGGSIRLIGGIAKPGQMARILKSSDYFSVSLHFGCGYLTTAMKIHEMGREIMLLLCKAEELGQRKAASYARGFLKDAMDAVFKGGPDRFNPGVLVLLLEESSGRRLSKESKGMLRALFSAQTSEDREIAKHMHNRNILEWNDRLGTVAMPSAIEVDEHCDNAPLLLENRSAEERQKKNDQRKYFEKITLMVAKNEMDVWQKAIAESGSNCIVKVQVKNYRNAVVASTESGINMKDAITGKDII